MKQIRSLSIACSNKPENGEYEANLLSSLDHLSESFAAHLKDLRSQIVREACVTIA